MPQNEIREFITSTTEKIGDYLEDDLRIYKTWYKKWPGRS